MTTLAVTGATGGLGGRTARVLATQGLSLHLLVRDPARAPDLPGASVAVATYADADAVKAALDGIETVLMVSGSEAPDRVEQHRTFVEAAAAAGVGQVVYTSFVAARPDATFTLGRDHYATEEILRASGMRWTFLRDNLYADVLPGLVGDDGALRGPAGDGRLAAVARDDIADAAAAVLLDPAAHAGRSYDLTGPEALSFSEIAEIITRETGRQVRYVEETVEEAFASRAHYGAPDWEVAAWVSTYTAVAAGDLAVVSGDLPSLTGSPATSLGELLRSTAR